MSEQQPSVTGDHYKPPPGHSNTMVGADRLPTALRLVGVVLVVIREVVELARMIAGL